MAFLQDALATLLSYSEFLESSEYLLQLFLWIVQFALLSLSTAIVIHLAL